MTNTHTEDADATIAQILRLEEAGCEIIRSTVPTLEAAEAFAKIKKNIHIPIVADIHFDYRMALAAMENGADAIRINPGNIGGAERIKAVVDMARERQIPIRVGVNSGSLEKEIVQKYGRVTAEGLVESALDKVRIIEDLGYDQMVISIKSSDVLMCIRAHELIAEQTDSQRPAQFIPAQSNRRWASALSWRRESETRSACHSQAIRSRRFASARGSCRRSVCAGAILKLFPARLAEGHRSI